MAIKHPLALQRRLATDSLRESDKVEMATAKRVREMERRGVSSLDIAREIGKDDRHTRRYMQGPVYLAFAAHLDAIERGDEGKLVDKIVRQAKNDFAQFAPDAIQYIRECFRRTDDGKAWKDDGKAQWATQLVAKGLGLTEPETAVRPQINIAGHYIHIETQQVKEDDEEARNAIIDVTPVQLDA